MTNTLAYFQLGPGFKNGWCRQQEGRLSLHRRANQGRVVPGGHFDDPQHRRSAQLVRHRRKNGNSRKGSGMAPPHLAQNFA
jgi:hypothetical protein